MNNLFLKHPTKKTDAVKRQAHIVRNDVLLGDWEEVKGISAETLRADLAPEKLDGLIIKGYEMKFGATNENGERYEKTAFDDFIKSYFVDGGLNMPVDINHQGYADWRSYCGRVLYCEVTTTGLYFVVYVPRTYAEYDRLVWGLKNGIIQGFSKEGFVDFDDYEYKWKEDGSFDYELIKKISIVSVSLVTTPANGISFERMAEVRNALVFANTIEEEKKQGKSLAELFNNH